MGLSILERMPLRLNASVVTPEGGVYRWSVDATQSANTLGDATFSTSMPGGFDQCQITLARNPSLDYHDLTEFSSLTIDGVAGRAWEGRLETSPRSSGSQMNVQPSFVGWQSALTDNNNARVIYVDISLSNWVGPSVSRQLALDLAGADGDGPVIANDPTGTPSVATQLTANWGRARNSEAWYDAKGLPIGSLYYAWQRNTAVISSDTNWSWRAGLSDGDTDPLSGDVTSELRAAGPGSGTLTATTDTRKWAAMYLHYATASAGTDGTNDDIFWQPAIYGDHGLTGTGPSPVGFLASDIVMHAVTTWAPEIAVTQGNVPTIDTSTYVIPHLVFTDPTTPLDIITQATRFELLDWAVWEGPTFWMTARNGQARSWQARVGPAGLQETGPQVDRMFNSVVVTYRDVTGVTRSVGPIGSGANTEDASLTDPDPTNPCTLAGITRRQVLPLDVSTAAAAIDYGANWLAEQRLNVTAGQAAIVGHVQDAAGVWWPSYMIRAGDNITFVDAHDTTPRRIVKTSYSDNAKTNTLSLDNPPDGLQEMLERLNESVAGLGL